MAKLTAAGYRFPAPADGVQVNFCKNVSCEAFGVSESLHRVSRAKVSLSRSQGLHPRGGLGGPSARKVGHRRPP